MITLTNPLTTEEKRNSLRIIGHDCLSFFDTVCLGVENSINCQAPITEGINHYSRYIESVLRTLSMIDAESIGLRDTPNSHGFKSSINNLADLCKDENRYDLEIKKEPFELYTFAPFMHTVLWNFIKNSAEVTARAKLNIGPSDFPENPTFVPDGAKDYDKFVEFSVHDNGKGFPHDKDWKEYFTKCPAKGERGFGLYFTGLIAKILRAPLKIKSSPGNTSVSFYHPIYSE